MLFLTACESPKSSDNAPISAAFVPAACTFKQTVAAPAHYGVPTVDEYECAMYSKMTCIAEAYGDEFLQLNCEAIDANDPQGVPGGCTEIPPLPMSPNVHGFLDGIVRLSRNYRCGELNGNLTCGYYTAVGPPAKEEIRCYLNN